MGHQDVQYYAHSRIRTCPWRPGIICKWTVANLTPLCPLVGMKSLIKAIGKSTFDTWDEEINFTLLSLLYYLFVRVILALGTWDPW